MIHALSDEGRAKLNALVTQPILYAFDFDGTLAPISSDRDAVTMAPSMRRWLTDLNHRLPCAIVSGRALADLTPRINGAVTHLIGNHGMESPLTHPATLLSAEEVCRKWTETVMVELASAMRELGVDMERKRYTLTFHYRGAADPIHAGRALPGLLNRLLPAPRLTFGHLCVNALPPGHRGKGVAAAAFMTHLKQSALFYIGDDGADEEVFALPGCLAMSIRVGPQPDSAAQFYLSGQPEVEELVRYLVQQWDRRAASPAEAATGATTPMET